MNNRQRQLSHSTSLTSCQIAYFVLHGHAVHDYLGNRLGMHPLSSQHNLHTDPHGGAAEPSQRPRLHHWLAAHRGVRADPFGLA